MHTVFTSFDDAVRYVLEQGGVQDFEVKGLYLAGTRNFEGLEAELLAGEEGETPLSRAIAFTVGHSIGGQTFEVKYVAVFGPVPRLDDGGAVEDDGQVEGEVSV